MAARSLTERVEILEPKVAELQELPTRMAAVESQILQLRGEMRDGFSAINARLGTHDQQFESIDRRFDSLDQRFEDLKTYMRVLHEEALSRIAVTKEAPTPNGRGRKKR